MNRIPALMLTTRFSPLLTSPLAVPRMTMPRNFRAGDRVCVMGNTDHPTMTVVGQQPDLFETDKPARVLCTWKARGKDGKLGRRYVHFEPARIHRVSGLAEDA
jgi:hypothetical protein